ncbi:MAG: divergent family protein [Neobacillus sp.]|jgi:acid phosphatase family membrane protein YuiD|nr:divergent family protein [Neobacillus sp.]
MLFVAAPFIAWLVAGSMKFVVNYIRFGKAARKRIGNGGFPSNHTTIMTTTVFFIGFHEGFYSPIFALGVAITFIVIIDATGLRRHVGLHAANLNKYVLKNVAELQVLRESMGHTKFEILGGVILGFVLGYLLYYMNVVLL